MACAPRRLTPVVPLLLLAAAVRAADLDPAAPPLLGARAPPHSHAACSSRETCTSGGLCTGPHTPYPVRPDIVYSAVFNVPELPLEFDMSMTYYNYFNIYFDGLHRIPGARFNQFVPQLMLGAALANSSGFPDYHPKWLNLSTWHIGAQYFMEFNEAGFDREPYRPAAVTGQLVPVEPGELVSTSFELSPDGEEWTLRMAVLGASPPRESIVVSTRPFMGLLKTASSWKEFNRTVVGACWENYRMKDRGSFPPGWKLRFTGAGAVAGDWWHNWTAGEPNCSWAPRANVSSWVSEDRRIQVADWDVFFPSGDGAAEALFI